MGLGREEKIERRSGIREGLGRGIYRDRKEMSQALTATALICWLWEDKGIWEKGIECRIRTALPAYPSLLSSLKQEKPGTRKREPGTSHVSEMAKMAGL
ncbi:unnamed protein product [Euphydryas editha]|uniref:Uncharacterized protein n=1 Tax=Euphydryas editha TaxID=104508 RepID=A0AAU9VAZ4_EUPED|nr:unnamed protein product [Euphydryas editha]